MAARFVSSLCSLTKSRACTEVIKRGISTTSSCGQDGGWLNKLLVRKIEPTKESHSRMLSDKEIIYELQTHNLKPGTADEYLKNYSQYVQEVKERNLHLELCGSWTVGVGDQDQCVHLWKYDGGYKSIDQAKRLMDDDSVIQNLMKDRNKTLRARTNQYLLSFSFWPAVTPRQGENIYEIRSYFLKPGTMIEWGNNWARAITFRQSNNEAFGGFFSQVGRLYNVHHIWYSGTSQATEVCSFARSSVRTRGGSLDGMRWWPTRCRSSRSTTAGSVTRSPSVPHNSVSCYYLARPRWKGDSGYSDMDHRKQSREDAWRHPGWDEVVAYTVPLIREMHTRIMYPNDFSPAH
ncbi:NIPSNAP protein [Trinorchestia longiramus]|nr:NIPSNAP protein [Trinorchestia longiramus]